MGYSKQWLPLECNPDLSTQLIHRLCVLPNIVFQDVFSLDPEILSLVRTSPDTCVPNVKNLRERRSGSKV